MKFLPLMALPLLAACGSFEPLVAPPVMDNPQCRAEAQRGPERAAARASNFDNQTQVRRLLTEERDAERRLYEACMRRLGLPTPGGVEPIRRS